MELPQLVQLVSGAWKGLFPVYQPAASPSPGKTLALSPLGAVDPVFLGVGGGNAASTYPITPGSKVDGGRA